MALVSFIKDRVDEDTHAKDHALLVHTGILWKIDHKGIGIGKDFHSGTLGFLEDHTDMRIDLGVVGVVDTIALLAASFSAWVALGTAVDATTSAASWWSHHIHLIARIVKDLELRHAVVVGLSGLSKDLASRRKGGLLTAAALAATGTATVRTVNRNNLSFRVQLLDRHRVWVAWLAKATAATARLFQRVKDLGATDEVLEFRVGLAAQDLLEAACREAKGSKNVRTFSNHCK